MRRILTWAGLLAIFVAGCVTGAVVVGVFGHHMIELALHGEKGAVEKTVLGHLVKKLDLDATAREEIRPIVAETAKDIRELRRRLAPEIETIIDRGATRIKERLDPERGRKFDTMLEKWRAKRSALFKEPAAGAK